MTDDLIQQLESKIEALETDKVLLQRELQQFRQLQLVVKANDEKLATMQRMANIFSWEVATLTGQMKCSPKMLVSLPTASVAEPQLSDLYALIHPEDLEAFRKGYERSQITAEPFESEHRIIKRNSEVRFVKHFCKTFTAEGGLPLKTIGLMLDVTVQRSLEQQLQKQALYDDLTRLKNRRSYNVTAQSIHNTLNRLGGTLGFILIDVDNFKAYNDLYGHVAGDTALKTVSGLMADCFKRGNDHLFRIGGEEFCVLIENVSKEELIRLADKLRKAVLEAQIPHQHNTDFGVMTVSLGLAFADVEEMPLNIESLYKDADKALYTSKVSGRNMVTYI